ncbi:MAG TPA: DUF4332 domain-containing protein [Methanobacteriaceae archaeon]|nr:DUF4332 domain-containing protein [Methanobacteriaceae archaeon]
MSDDYYINLSEYPLNKFKEELMESELLPSRQILKEDLKDRFKILKENGISNLAELMSLIKTTKKAKDFSLKSGLPEKYVLILRREVSSYQPRPVNLDKFPGVNEETVRKLQDAKIKTTVNLFERIKTPEDRKKLTVEFDINPDELLTLTKLTDLSRVKWVGPIFARIFLDSNTDTVDKLSKAEVKPLYENLIEINQEKNYTKSHFIETDVQLCVNFARKLPKVIKY